MGGGRGRGGRGKGDVCLGVLCRWLAPFYTGVGYYCCLLDNDNDDQDGNENERSHKLYLYVCTVQTVPSYFALHCTTQKKKKKKKNRTKIIHLRKFPLSGRTNNLPSFHISRAIRQVRSLFLTTHNEIKTAVKI